jgi:hypothetical protein
MNRRTVARLARSSEPPRYRRAPAGSKLDPFEGVLRGLLEEWPQIKAPRVTEILRDDYGYEGSVDLVRRRLQQLRPSSSRPAQRTGYRPGQVLQLDWTELPSRPRIAGRERRIYALVGSLPFSGAQSAHFSFIRTHTRHPAGRDDVHGQTRRTSAGGSHPWRTGNAMVDRCALYGFRWEPLAIPRTERNGRTCHPTAKALSRDAVPTAPPTAGVARP